MCKPSSLHLFRTQLPAYLEQQEASIVAHCPLPGVLQPLVAEYAAPTSEDMWTDGLRVSVFDGRAALETGQYININITMKENTDSLLLVLLHGLC
jgi:hypothetical protein